MELIYFIIIFTCCVFAYKYGEGRGKFIGVMSLAEGIREKIEISLIEPWYSDFKNRFMVNKDYTVDQETLLACLGLAKKLYQVRSFIPDNEIFKSNRGYNLANFICSFINSEHAPKGLTIDTYFGSPGGYVDAILDLIVMSEGKYPKEIWLNEKSGEITDCPKKDENYINFRLE